MASKTLDNRRRLHPLVAFFSALKSLRDMLPPLLILLIASIFKGNVNSIDIYIKLGVGVAIALLSIIWGIFDWRTYTYRIEEGELRVEKGVWNKQKNYIPLQRIQSIDFSEGIFHRLFGLVRVHIQLAGGVLKEIQLTAIGKSEGEELKRELLARKSSLSPEQPVDIEKEGVKAQPERKITTRELIFSGLTSGRIGLMIVGMLTVYSSLSEVFNAMAMNLTQYLPRDWMAIAVFSLVILFVAWVLSVVYSLLMFGNFKVLRDGDKLNISYGILEKKAFSIDMKRVQAVKIVEGVFRQPFGYVTLRLVSAGFDLDKKETGLLFPLLKKKEIEDFLQTFVPEYADSLELHPLPEKARSRYIFWNVVFWLPIIAGLIWFFPVWGLLSLVLLPASALFGWMKFRDGGFALKQDRAVFRWRKIARTTAIVSRKRIQSTHLNCSYFQKRKGLASCYVKVAASSTGDTFGVRNLDEKDGVLIFESIKRNK